MSFACPHASSLCLLSESGSPLERAWSFVWDTLKYLRYCSRNRSNGSIKFYILRTENIPKNLFIHIVYTIPCDLMEELKTFAMKSYIFNQLIRIITLSSNGTNSNNTHSNDPLKFNHNSRRQGVRRNKRASYSLQKRPLLSRLLIFDRKHARESNSSLHTRFTVLLSTNLGEPFW